MSQQTNAMDSAPVRRTGKPTIGVVGGVGSGKSFVSRALASLGAGVIDADQLAKDALREPAVQSKLRSWWGDEIFDTSGQINRQKVGAIVFSSPDELAKLESVLHPAVGKRRAQERLRMLQDPAILAIVEDSPLLMEKGLDRDCDVTIFVHASRSTRLRRVMDRRGWTAQELDRREGAQLRLDIKQSRADYIVDNDGDEAACQAAVERVFSRILQDYALK